MKSSWLLMKYFLLLVNAWVENRRVSRFDYPDKLIMLLIAFWCVAIIKACYHTCTQKLVERCSYGGYIIMKKRLLLLFSILTLAFTGCSRIRGLLPVVRDKVTVANFVPEPDPKVCIGLPEGLNQPTNATCYLIAVPEDRTLTKSPLIEIYVMVVKHEEVAEPDPDPILILFDGPGAPISSRQYPLLNHFLEISRLANRRVIVMDMRGAGESRPALSCYLEKPELLTNPDYDWVMPCLERLENEAINVAAYNPLQIAQDVRDIVTALGYPQVNIWARGFGTSVALRFVDMNPNLVRSMLLESVNTIFSDLGLPTGLNGALDRAFEDCENNDFCNQQFPDLRQQFGEAYTQLESEPIKTVFGLLDADGYIQDIQTILSETSFGVSLLPLYIKSVWEGDVAAINAISTDLRAINKNQFGISDVLQSVYVCSEITDNGSVDDILQQINTNVRPEIYDSVRRWLLDEFIPRCNQWPSPGLDNNSGGRISSEVPILLLAGTYAPRFSLESAYFANVTLTNSAIVAVQGVGRDPLFPSNECTFNFVAGFFANPSLIPDSMCLNQQVNHVMSVDPYNPAAEIEIKEFHDFDVPDITVSGARPAEWVMVKTGQYLRRNFENDPTGIFHLYEKGQSAEAVVNAYFASEGISPSLEASSDLVTGNGLSFQVSQYAIETPEFILVFDVAVFETGWGGFAIIMKTTDFEFSALHEAVFLPAVQAFTFY
jgi:pimeloyl-ACP methyl ester carboxylesterase